MSAASLPIEILHRFSRKDYERLVDLGAFEGERVELLHGMLVQMSPHPPRHDGTLQWLAKRLTLAVGDLGEVRVQMAFALSDDSEPEPDIAVVPPGRYLDAHPDRALLLVEVAWSSLDYDGHRKGPAYAAAGVPEYWLVDVEGRQVVRFTEPTPGGYAHQDVVVLGAPVPVGALPAVAVDLSGLFVIHAEGKPGRSAHAGCPSATRSRVRRERPTPGHTRSPR